ncbi:MAG TPA: hypothetical protein DCY55_05110 [Gammaproteobacteria bacterium]|nr:hypothetical protein [Gammaproteobacteria bacterium]
MEFSASNLNQDQVFMTGVIVEIYAEYRWIKHPFRYVHYRRQMFAATSLNPRQFLGIYRILVLLEVVFVMVTWLLISR